MQLIEGTEKPYGQIQEYYKWLELWHQFYAYSTSGLGLKKIHSAITGSFLSLTTEFRLKNFCI